MLFMALGNLKPKLRKLTREITSITAVPCMEPYQNSEDSKRT